MGISNHELHNEFPQYSNLIDELKTNDLHFQDRMKQQRAHLKDELYQELLRKSNGAG